MNTAAFVDPFLRTTDGILHTPNCVHPFDFVQGKPGPSLIRTYEYIPDRKQIDLPKYKNQVLCKGSAVGLDQDDKIVHFFSGRGLRFAGFLEGQTIDRAALWARGSVVLDIEGADDKKHRGAKVYCSGPNEFSLDHKRGSAEIGKIRFVQDGRSHVFFKQEDDKEPCYLIVN
jgi:hypothetical protein